MSLKGGSGKTTLSLNLAGAALRDGARVVLADTDPQRSLTETLANRQSPPPYACEPTTLAKLFPFKHECQRKGAGTLIIDTAPVISPDLAQAVNVSNLCIVVARPTIMDLTAAVKSVRLVNQLNGRVILLLNQAPHARQGIEAPIVRNAMAALAHEGIPTSPVIIRSRAAYQYAAARGRTVIETAEDPAASDEILALWGYLQSFFPALTVARAS